MCDIIVRATPLLSERDLERFWVRVAITANPNICWNWIGFRARGYGTLGLKTEKGFKPFRANRLSYIIHNGIDPLEKIVMHTCDNPSCVNPNHLKLGTYADNMEDKIKKGRHNAPYSINHWKAKLDENKVKEIKYKVSNGMTHASVANEYGIYESVVSRIMNGKAWAKVL